EFTSDAGGLVPGDDGRAGVYWKDMSTGEIREVGNEGIGEHPHISLDGRFVEYDTETGVYREDMTSGLAQAVTPDANGVSTADSISADGNIVAFSSTASNVVGDDTNGTTDVFVRDMTTGAAVRSSTRADGSQLDGPSYAGALSGDGHFVAFASRATGVVPGTAAAARARVYRKDVATGAVDLASVGINLAPRSLIAEPLGKLPRRKARIVSGTTEDDGTVVRLDASLSRSLGHQGR